MLLLGLRPHHCRGPPCRNIHPRHSGPYHLQPLRPHYQQQLRFPWTHLVGQPDPRSHYPRNDCAFLVHLLGHLAQLAQPRYQIAFLAHHRGHHRGHQPPQHRQRLLHHLCTSLFRLLGGLDYRPHQPHLDYHLDCPCTLLHELLSSLARLPHQLHPQFPHTYRLRASWLCWLARPSHRFP